MNLFKQHIEYLKDNPEGYWFKRKLYGWGWVPARWQGWLTLFIWIIFYTYTVFLIMKYEKPEMLVLIIPEIILLLYICYKKGEKPKWQWGFKR